MNNDLILKFDRQATQGASSLIIPKYNPNAHSLDLARSPYYHDLMLFRAVVKQFCDSYMNNEIGAMNVDLYMLTTSVSSPMGPGSDSEALPVKLGQLDAFLTDSSQFGFEPLLLNTFKKVYCYLPSLRGEDYSPRHLNQFYHCELEIVGDFDSIQTIVERFITKYARTIVEYAPRLITSLSRDSNKTFDILKKLASAKKFKELEFEEACKMLENDSEQGLINKTVHGRDITPRGEKRLVRLMNAEIPFWVINYDRDRVPFYQQPLVNNVDKVRNGDLIFPGLTRNSFGGEIVGAGERANSSIALRESLKRQSLSAEPYEWYIQLRDDKGYSTTSGFGVGIERLISWTFALEDIKYSIPYPRLKNVRSRP